MGSEIGPYVYAQSSTAIVALSSAQKKGAPAKIASPLILDEYA